ncbi:Coenzyme F420 hydrogenase/dehydrogenase, beta subunit C-terminal domain [Nocardioides sp. Soil805]|uniref:Coenzyme F420 hydrogenase/dehydrogenase, beta subunit C-terminal domain n=1 Tax=Nocardioides sp. Soil805 TaxID=1736416 RepID=UPI0007031687|nr:Coenzyme F420 hydrogenase/dehydrogenase, beta subunit C-terminal domain [Nocardioides sp. Soil805]KRF35053.1 hypothetical protein ASG94_13050 [Nocardioides sp. Soil805]
MARLRLRGRVTDRDPLEVEVARVLNNDNCSGCGACALLDPRIVIEDSADGFLRPRVCQPRFESSSSNDLAEQFKSVCPGVGLASPESAGDSHPTFGRYLGAWEAWAADPEVRRQGSSGGVITALSLGLVEAGEASGTHCVASSPTKASRTVPITITSRDEALAAAGSRYAPVATLSQWSGAEDQVLVAKPCEVAAARGYHRVSPGAGAPPLMISFFCAGTPSQHATDRLVTAIGRDVENLTSLRYRGDGWPGSFAASDIAGTSTLSYEESWGQHLGRDLQWRCKLCVDGTGEFADIAVGDYWKTDAKGFPVFSENDGSSVVIARTPRGLEVLRSAIKSGVIVVRELSLDAVAGVQPLQRQRRAVLSGRLLGRRLAGKVPPHYRGYGLYRGWLSQPVATARTTLGTWARSRRKPHA